MPIIVFPFSHRFAMATDRRRDDSARRSPPVCVSHVAVDGDLSLSRDYPPAIKLLLIVPGCSLPPAMTPFLQTANCCFVILVAIPALSCDV